MYTQLLYFFTVSSGNFGVEDSGAGLSRQNEELKTEVERLEGDIKGLEWSVDASSTTIGNEFTFIVAHPIPARIN